MTLPTTRAPGGAPQTFLRMPYQADLAALDAHVAILGIPHCAPYHMHEATNDQSRAPDAIRAQSDQYCYGLSHWDFDLGGPLMDGREIRIVDCGNVPGDPFDIPGNIKRAEQAMRAILARNALPIVFGGDHGATVPAMRAYEGRGPITLVHLDAHLDWRDHVNGVKDGYSSPIRRASELPWVDRIVQIGMRGIGSARKEEVDAARAYGCDIVDAFELHDRGIGAVLERIPKGGNYYLSIDADGLDPAVMPAVMAPVPGGITYPQERAIIHHLCKVGRVVGMDIVEITPSADVNHITSIVAGRLAMNLIGMGARAGWFGKN